MRITLISPCAQINAAFGIRTLSSHLRAQGHQTRLVFLPDFNDYAENIHAGPAAYRDETLKDLFPLCEDSDLIGISVMTTFFSKSVWITQALKKRLRKPVIWGGAHPTSKPEETLQYADVACIGEGEESLLELMNRMARGEQFLDIRGLWFRKDGAIIRNGARPLETDLDRYPMPDNSAEDHYILWDNRIVPLTNEISEAFSKPFYPAKDFSRNGYLTLSSRGCPHQCAYCHNSLMKDMYAGQRYLRWRSISHFIEELATMRKTMPYIEFVYICDDLFLARSSEELREFSAQYVQKVGIPFMCGTDPLSVTEQKLQLLADAGMVGIQMGVESGSSRVQALFNRKSMTNERMLRSMRVINRFSDRIVPYYDFILDTPYESDADKMDTLRLISRIPRPYRLGLYALVLLPGTKLYKKAIEDGVIRNEVKEVYEKHFFIREPSYANLLILLCQNLRFPGQLLRFLVSRPAEALLNSGIMRPVVRQLYILAKRIHGRFIAPGQNPSLQALRPHYP